MKQYQFRIGLVAAIILALIVSIRQFISANFSLSLGLLLLSFLIFILLLVELKKHLLFCLNQLWMTIKNIRWKFLSILIFDALFYVGLFRLFFFSWTRIGEVLVLIQDAINNRGEALQGLTLEGWSWMALVFVGGFVLWILFKGIVWFLSTEKSFSWKYYLNFAAISALLFVGWYAILKILVLILNPVFMTFFFMLIGFPFILYSSAYIFTLIGNLGFVAIKEGIELSVKKVHMFAIPYLISLFLYLILYILMSPLVAISMTANALAVIFVTFVYVNFVRIYMVRLMKHHSKHF